MAKSDLTKQKILESAKALFMEKGYTNVTVREIASSAKVSHTTIYLYYKDKADLLNEIALLPLMEFEKELMKTFEQHDKEPRVLIKETGKALITFGLTHRTMYDVYFNQGSVNVQLENPPLEVNKIRNRLFGRIMEAFKLLYPTKPEEKITVFSRMYYYFLNGLISSYANNTEEAEVILCRIQPTIEEMLEIILNGIDHYESDAK